MACTITYSTKKQKSFRNTSDKALKFIDQPKCKPSTILIVDDRPENLVALEAVLSSSWYKIVAANSGEEALRILLNLDVSLILLDVQMPGLDGFETAEIIKAREKTAHIPIIFITAANQASEHVQRGYEIGAVDYIFKPFSLEILRFKIEAVLNLYRDYENMARIVHVRTERLHITKKQLKEEVSERIKVTDAFHTVFQASPCLLAIYSIDDKQLVEVNQSWLNQTGYRSGEAISKDIKLQEVIVGGDTDQQLWLGDTLKDGLRNVNTTYLTATGERRDAYLSTEKLELYQQLCILIVITDITEKKQMEIELARFDRLNVIGEMAAGIGHEVRNPMTTVRGYLQIFQRKEKFAEYQGQICTMIEELDRANSIITEFLSLAKNKTVEMKRGNLNDVIHALFPLLQADAFRMGHQILVDTGDIPDSIFDEKEIRQLILNLVRNGFEAMKQSGIVSILTYIDNGQLILMIKDTGSGIPQEVLGKLGTPFVTTKDNGTGLGLPVCYRIAERHGTKVEIDSASNGTTVLVRFKM